MAFWACGMSFTFRILAREETCVFADPVHRALGVVRSHSHRQQVRLAASCRPPCSLAHCSHRVQCNMWEGGYDFCVVAPYSQPLVQSVVLFFLQPPWCSTPITAATLFLLSPTHSPRHACAQAAHLHIQDTLSHVSHMVRGARIASPLQTGETSCFVSVCSVAASSARSTF